MTSSETIKTRLVVAYDGTDFSGWQIQVNAPSIQATLEDLLQQVLRHPVRVIGAGRTDAGVHALGQVAHFKHEQPIDHPKLMQSLNGLLPPSIRVLSVDPADSKFHAQHSAKGKIYHYSIGLGRVADPLRRRYRTQFHPPLDLHMLKEAAAHFIGTFDFTSFANQSSEGSAAKDAIRTIDRLDIIEEPGGLRLEFEGNGFLYKMVRNIVGTLLDVGTGKRRPDDIPQLLRSRDRRCIGMAAPPEGLCLIKVNY